MDVCVFGAGYVGLVSGVCFADFGHRVTLVDIDEHRVERLKAGYSPIYEQGLQPCLQRNIAGGRLFFTTDAETGVGNAEVIFLAVGTPSLANGDADLSGVFSVARTIGKYMDGYKLIVGKSTVPVGTAGKVCEIIAAEIKARNKDIPFDIASNPEFLREGKAMEDFMNPHRILLGVSSEKALSILREIYRPLVYKEVPLIITNVQTAELSKYASNAFLAAKIAFINEISGVCEQVGADVTQVAEAMGIDARIGKSYLAAGPGFGGSCFPKDTRALAHIGRTYDMPLRLVEATIEANELQKRRMPQKILNKMGDIKDKQFAILGLTFKPETDDMRESPSIELVRLLTERGAKLRAFDPKGTETSKEVFADILDSITYCTDAYEALEGADAAVLVTEWEQFALLDLPRVKKLMAGNYFFDLRNVFRRAFMSALGFDYEGVGV